MVEGNDISDEFIVVGKITSPFGVKGWVKIHSYTDPEVNILEYAPWYLDINGEWQAINVLAGRPHGKGIAAQLEGISDRDAAQQYGGRQIAVTRSQLPAVDEGQHYWVDLIGMKVVNLEGDELGVVDGFLETGANDVIVVRGDQERLIPFVLDRYVMSIDEQAREMKVDWDKDY
jgi:16S rRNA processing protein RimM